VKFCYIDESGMGEEPYATMVGIVVDSQRMAPTKAEWAELLATLSGIVGRGIDEFHTHAFYPGNGIWRGIGGAERAEIIAAIIAWLEARKHHIVYSAVDKAAYARLQPADPRISEIGSIWRMLALHVALAIQKKYQSEKKNKGHSVLVFDNREGDRKGFTNLMVNPPAWTDTYYARGKKQSPLDMIVDVPHFVDSKHVGLIQVADLLSYLLRHHIELHNGHRQENYAGEAARISDWVETALARTIGGTNIYPKRGRCAAGELFYACAPEPVRNT